MEATYGVTSLIQEGEAVYVLSDLAGKAEARLVPGIGNNLFRFEAGGNLLITGADTLGTLRKYPSRFGYPILFPPNAVRDAAFTFQGREYRLPPNHSSAHHIHGELKSKRWNVIAHGADADNGAYVTSELRIADHEDIRAYYPHDLSFRFTYRLKDGCLSLEGCVTNLGDEEAPYALGLHPYFSVLTGELGEVVVQLPAREEWPVDGGFVSGGPEETGFCRSLRNGIRLDEVASAGYRLVSFQEDGAGLSCSKVSIRYPRLNNRLIYEVDNHFPYAVIFRPSWLHAVSIEPYSCLTDAFNLPFPADRTGARGLKPGEVTAFCCRLYVSENG